MTQPNHATTRQRITDQAAKIMASNPLFLDTETTGLRGDAEIVEIAVLDHEGETLLNTLVRPTLAVPDEAIAIHGITNEQVCTSRPFDAILEPLTDLLWDRVVVIYNVEYDMKLMNQSLRARRAAVPDWTAIKVQPVCAMKMYAEWHGEKNEWDSWKWQKLSDAAKQCRLELPEDLHRARADCEITLRIMQRMAAG